MKQFFSSLDSLSNQMQQQFDLSHLRTELFYDEEMMEKELYLLILADTKN